MRHTKSLVCGLLVCGLALATTGTASAQAVKQLKAKVVRIKGTARFTSGNGEWHPLKVGDVLKAGNIIQTDQSRGSYVDLVLGDGTGSVPTVGASSTSAPSTSKPSPASNYQPKAEQNFVRVWENSALGIDKLTSMETGSDTVTETQLDLRAGHILGSVKKMSAASKYEVKIPNGVAGIRGTIYDITADGVIKVSSGSVVLAWVSPDGTVVTQVVNGGNQFDARSGQSSPLSADAIRSMEVTQAAMGAGVGATGLVTTTIQPENKLIINSTTFFVSPVLGP
jgi:hypothetical protein